MSILFTIVRILNPVLLISSIVFPLLPIFRETSCIPQVHEVHGISIAAAKLVSIENIAKLANKIQM
jgi:hypothetical protein